MRVSVSETSLVLICTCKTFLNFLCDVYLLHPKGTCKYSELMLQPIAIGEIRIYLDYMLPRLQIVRKSIKGCITTEKQIFGRLIKDKI